MLNVIWISIKSEQKQKISDYSVWRRHKRDMKMKIGPLRPYLTV